MKPRFPLINAAVAGHYDANFVVKLFNGLRERAGDVCQSAGLGKRFNLTGDEQIFNGFAIPGQI